MLAPSMERSRSVRIYTKTYAVILKRQADRVAATGVRASIADLIDEAIRATKKKHDDGAE